MNTEQLKKEIRDLNLTDEEKRALLRRVMEAPLRSPYAPARSGWLFVHKRIMYVGAAALAVIISGTSVAYASLGSVPGDSLYPVKVSVVEPALDLLAFTPEKKAERQADKAIRRLSEAEKLTLDGQLTADRTAEIETRFRAAADDFTAALSSAGGESERTDDLRVSFEASLSAHANLLRAVADDNADENSAVSSLEGAVSEKASSAAGPDGGQFGKFDSRKSSIESLLRTAARNIGPAGAAGGDGSNSGSENDESAGAETNPAGSDKKKIWNSILDDSRDNLSQARQRLHEAEERRQSGDDTGADLLLRESYKKAVEANISSQEGSRLRQELGAAIGR